MRYAYNSGYYHDVYSAMMSAMVVIYMVIALVNLVIYVLSIIADYRLFEKAGEEGWKAIIPFYNYFVLCRIVMGDSLWFWLGFVPGINVFGRLYIRFKTGEAPIVNMYLSTDTSPLLSRGLAKSSCTSTSSSVNVPM